jgi:hypothetical protein
LVNVFEQVVVDESVEPTEDEIMVADEELVLAVEAYNLNNKMLHKDLVQNEIVAVVVEELILDLKVFRQCSKYKNGLDKYEKEKKIITLISNNCNEICCEY